MHSKMIHAKWIWKKQDNYNLYNQTIIARKTFVIDKIESAKIMITADSFYRLFINSEWINDGPCRSWHTHFQYDKIDVTFYLKSGSNEIRIIARYWGVGTFHNLCQQAGLLAQLEIEFKNGETRTIITDDSWEVAESRAWIENTPKVSVQMEPQEFYDARLEELLEFSNAKVVFDADNGPWKDLNPRDVALLTKKPFPFKLFLSANLVQRKKDINFCVPVAGLFNPGVIEANHNVSSAGGIGTLIHLEQPAQIGFFSEEFNIRVNGKTNADNEFHLSPGNHFVLAFAKEVFGHRKEKSIRIVDPPLDMTLINPMNSNYENPWCWIPFPEFKFIGDDLNWLKFLNHRNDNEIAIQYQEKVDEFFQKVADVNSFREQLGNRVQQMPSDQMFVRDTHWQFLSREVVDDASNLIENPVGLLSNNDHATVVNPSLLGDIELVLDLGEQNCGYYDFEIIANAGVVVDIYGVEYIAPDGKIQHTADNHNGMRYITKQGINRFTSLKRRSGRYIFMAFRNQTSPIQIRKFRLIESTYPVNPVGRFQCNDSRLNQIWEISARTLKLCMEDTFTDCPLYEQTLWVGDARNEAVFALHTFDAQAIARRCITLAGQSLERFPMVGCQVPSSWDILLPAWSFLWGISAWDYFFYSGDVDFLKKSWQWVIRNLQGAEKLVNDDGLFSCPFWNLFDWSGIDDKHLVVLHNSMLLVGAIAAAQQCAQILLDQDNLKWLNNFRSKLISSINQLWDDVRKAYPDSIHEDGNLSDSISQHTSFLSILYDIIEVKNFDAALKNMLNPPQKMVRVGSPFAMMYFYEALEKIGREDDIIKSIYESYLPMLEAGATTVWEVFPSSQFRPGGFPTRSHCHAWSSAPLFFLNRIILGIKQTESGGKAFEISPRLNGLKWAKGTIATAKGPLHVAWAIDQNKFNVKIINPNDMKIQFIKNETFENFEVQVTYEKINQKSENF
jgi:alpha-L-rhamnosidase